MVNEALGGLSPEGTKVYITRNTTGSWRVANELKYVTLRWLHDLDILHVIFAQRRLGQAGLRSQDLDDPEFG